MSDEPKEKVAWVRLAKLRPALAMSLVILPPPGLIVDQEGGWVCVNMPVTDRESSREK